MTRPNKAAIHGVVVLCFFAIRSAPAAADTFDITIDSRVPVSAAEEVSIRVIEAPLVSTAGVSDPLRIVVPRGRVLATVTRIPGPQPMRVTVTVNSPSAEVALLFARGPAGSNFSDDGVFDQLLTAVVPFMRLDGTRHSLTVIVPAKYFGLPGRVDVPSCPQPCEVKPCRFRRRFLCRWR